MKKLAIILGFLVLLAVIGLLLVVIGGFSYNHLVGLSKAVDGQWAQVQNVYQRRTDLIPNLVATVSGAANFEKSTLTEIAEARASVGRVNIDESNAPTSAQKLAEFEQAQNQLGGALSRLLVVSENYPVLRATNGFRDLQAQLEGTENRISVERGRFNDAVQAYNTAIASFPANLYASSCGFVTKPYFTATPAANAGPPAVQFNFGPSTQGH